MRSNWQQSGPPPDFDGPGGGGLHLAMPPITPVVKRLVIANAAVFLGCFALYLASDASWDFVRTVFGLSPYLWREWFPFVPVWQLASWGFLHSLGDPFHILKNMLFLYFLGTMLEGIVGPRRFIVTYAAALLVSGFVTLVLGLITGTTLPTIGASGAVLAIVVATATMRPTTRVIFILFPITLKTLAIFFVGLDLFFALSSLKGGGSNVAYAAHLSGAAFGFLIAWKGWIWRDPLAGVERWRSDRREAGAVRDAERVDQLLDRINREGIHSLSASDRAFLKRASKRR